LGVRDEDTMNESRSDTANEGFIRGQHYLLRVASDVDGLLDLLSLPLAAPVTKWADRDDR
jgi:hypothetical protein